MNKPNLFMYATGELSQDAIICYIASFYDEKYKESYPYEHDFANYFIKTLLEKVKFPIVFNSLKIKKQYKNIDVLFIFDEKYYLIIEDKTFTSEKKDQIATYIKALELDNIPSENIRALYFKIGDEALHELNKKSFPYFIRKDVINLFQNYKGNNLILNDYNEYIIEIQALQDDFIEKNPNEYSWENIIGFYNALDMEFSKRNMPSNNKGEKIIFSWTYVPNKSGGFLCYYFPNILSFNNRSYYLQIEKINIIKDNETKKRNTKWTKDIVKFPEIVLTLKLCSKEKSINHIELLYQGLDKFRNKFSQEFENHKFLKPNKFSKGETMTQLLFNDYLQLDNNGKIDIIKTANNIIRYINILLEMEELLDN